MIAVLVKYSKNGTNKAIKAALELMGYDIGRAVYPSEELSGQIKTELKSELAGLGIEFLNSFEVIGDIQNMVGMISDIQKFSLHDGPGIRTTVFSEGLQHALHMVPESGGNRF